MDSMKENSNNTNKISGYAWIVVAIVWVGYMIVNLANFSFGMMKTDIIDDLMINEQQFGWLGASAWMLKAAFSIPIALLISKFNAKNLLQGIFIAVAAGVLMQGFAQNYAMIFIGRGLVYGVAGAILAPLAVIKIKLIPKERMTFVNGIENFTGPAGQALGTALITSLIVLVGTWRNVFVFLGAIVIGVVILWTILCKKEFGETEQTGTKEKIQFFAPLKEACSHKTVWLLTLGWPGTGFIWNAIYTHWPKFAQGEFGLTPEQTGMVLACLPIGSVIGSLTSPKIASKIGYDKLMIWPWGFILPAAYFSMMYVPNITVLSICSFIAGYGAYAFVPIAFTLIYKIKGISPRAVSIGLAMIFTTNGLGGALGSIVPSSLTGSMGMKMALSVCCVSPILFGVLALFLPEKGRKAQERGEVD